MLKYKNTYVGPGTHALKDNPWCWTAKALSVVGTAEDVPDDDRLSPASLQHFASEALKWATRLDPPILVRFERKPGLFYYPVRRSPNLGAEARA